MILSNFEFRLFIDESDYELQVWVYEFERTEVCDKRTAHDWIMESFFDLVNPYEDFELDKDKAWQVIGKGRISGYSDYDGDFEENLHLIEFQKQELPSSYFEINGEA